MNEDAFARRFYADRSELEALRHLPVGREAGRRAGRAGDLLARARELPPAADRVHRPGAGRAAHRAPAARRRVRLRRAAAARAAADLLGPPQPAAARPSSIRWRSGSPARRAGTSSPSGWPRSRPRSSVARRSCSTTTRWSATTSASRRVDPYQLLFQGGQFYLVGHSHERKAIRVFRLSRIRGKVGYATKAEHDFQRPADFDPRAYANRIDWQFGEPMGTAEVWIGRRIAWQIERHFGRYGEMRPGVGGRRPRVRHALRQRPPADRLGARARASTPACSARPSSPTSCASGSSCWSSATPASPQIAAPAGPPARRAADRVRRRRGGRADDRWQRPPSRQRDPARALRPAGHAGQHPDRRRPGRAHGRRRRARASASRSPSRSCARTSRC